MNPRPASSAPLLAIGTSAAAAQALRQALDTAGIDATVWEDRLDGGPPEAPGDGQPILVHLAPGSGGMAPMLSALAGRPHGPIAVIAPAVDASTAAAWAAAGVAALWPVLDAATLPTLLAFACARHEALAAAHADAESARRQLDDRKWVERAKGLLMSARGLPEDEAFKLLRDAAMQTNLRLAQASRSVVDAARWGDAVNRAGQLRMLSQRRVALAARRLAGLEAAGGGATARAAARRMQENIEQLATLGLGGATRRVFEQVQEHAAALDAALAGRPDLRALLRADTRAEALREAADRLADALEVEGGRRALAIVNRCGSQRMRVQRLIKDALLDRLQPDATRTARLLATLAEFDDVQQRVEAAPLSSPEFRAALAATRETWLAVVRTLQGAELEALVQAGEQLLQQLDHLTACCERSLQLLMS